MKFALIIGVLKFGSVLSTLALNKESLLPSTNACGHFIESFIFGGKEASLMEYPWMGLLEYHKTNSKESFRCGGSLINNRYVLTAAHCLNQGDWTLKSVRLGEHNIHTRRDCQGKVTRVCAPPMLNLPIEEKIPHENYSATDVNHYNDIALLRLDQNVTFSDYVRPICLPMTAKLKEYSYKDNDLLTIAGWGDTAHTAYRKMSDVKMKVQLPFVNWVSCFNKHKNRNITLSTTQMCAGRNVTQDSCKGDSGGPLMAQHYNAENKVNWYVAGVLSMGSNYCGWGIPGVYTNVPSYVDWIISKIEP